jgi:hypothetical protein
VSEGGEPERPAVVRRAVRFGIEAVSVGGGAALAGIGCCGPLLIPWLGQLVFTLGGAAGLIFLIRYEAAVSLGVAAGSWLGWRLAPDRPTRAANALLGVVALVNGLVRSVWDHDPQPIMAIPPLYWAFSYRQILLGLLVALVLALRLASLLQAAAKRRDGRRTCDLATGERVT